jgi:ABC-type polysaccharide/polyol phosphate transport system ATPase subunit
VSVDPAIRCTGLSKVYGLGAEVSLQTTLRQALGRAPSTEPFYALHDVSFEVPRGALFGIVGQNGSGKSTLTSVIAGISVPSSGTVDVWGRVLPLLEVGAGFHEELTGRENIELLGTILGLEPPEITAATPDIIEFSGIARHMDTPMKRYSSGMRARLSFATAIGFPADIYVFDEILAVVDDDFRSRCSEALQALHDQGSTVILMSHDLEFIRSTCETGMWLDRGVVRCTGDIATVTNAYSEHPTVD